MLGFLNRAGITWTYHINPLNPSTKIHSFKEQFHVRNNFTTLISTDFIILVVRIVIYYYITIKIIAFYIFLPGIYQLQEFIRMTELFYGKPEIN